MYSILGPDELQRAQILNFKVRVVAEIAPIQIAADL